MDYCCVEFGGCIVSAVLVLSYADRHTHTDADERITPATTSSA